MYIIYVYFRLYPDLIYTNIYANAMRIQIRIGRVTVEWELQGFRIQFGWGRLEVGWILTSSDAHTTVFENGHVVVV